MSLTFTSFKQVKRELGIGFFQILNVKRVAAESHDISVIQKTPQNMKM